MSELPRITFDPDQYGGRPGLRCRMKDIPDLLACFNAPPAHSTGQHIPAPPASGGLKPNQQAATLITLRLGRFRQVAERTIASIQPFRLLAIG